MTPNESHRESERLRELEVLVEAQAERLRALTYTEAEFRQILGTG